jgi:NAD(P) transhydrogenase subunit alpha
MSEKAAALSNQSVELAENLLNIQVESQQVVTQGIDPLVFGITVFVLACFVGYYVVWKVTPALHTPLMSVTNAISSIIIVGAIIAMSPQLVGNFTLLGFAAVFLTSINIFGGFVVTQRMLSMFKKKN